MAQSVDTKIVELKFNNDNFAEKVDSTLTKLQNLNKAIDEDGLGNALKNLGKNAKQVDMKGVTKGVEEASKGFSKLEIAGITALANISNAAVNLGKRLVSKLVSPLTEGIMQGGLARAKNIEQATFQFEGQKIGKSKGHEDLSYYHEVMEAVLGTSYSYDVAAKAASQLAASNIGVEKTTRKLADGSKVEAKVLNEDMTHALLAIAGTASMTGSDFDSIAQIFTRVAGQGKVMAMDLNSIAARGLNAAAVLGNYLGKSEADIRDLVSKGKISFQDFANAMDQAFGQHAKDSTLQFQGALDDVNAALARIGADFYGKALTSGRDVLNSVTPLVDAIHNKLQPALDTSGNLMERASKSLSQYLDMLSYMIERFPNNDMNNWINEHMNAWTNIADLYKQGNLQKTVEGLKEYSKAFEGMDGKKGIDGFKMLGDYLNVSTNGALLSKYLDKTDEQIEQITKKGKLGAEDLKTVINGMIKDGTIGFNTFYKAFHKLWSESDDLMAIGTINRDFNEYVKTCTNAAEPTDRMNAHFKTFGSIIHGIASLFNSFKTMLGGVASIFLTLAQHLKPLGSMFVSLTQQVAQFVVYIADFIATSKSFNTVIDGVVSLIVKIFSLVDVSKIAGAALMGIGKAFDFIVQAVEKVDTGLSKVFTAIHNVINRIIDKIHEVVTNVDLLKAIFNDLKHAGLIVALINLIGAISQPMKMLKALGDAFTNVGDSVSGLFKQIGGVFKSIAGMVGKIGDAIDEVTNTLKRMQELIVATAILEIAAAIAVLAGALYLLSKVKVDNAADALKPLVGLAASAGALFSFMAAMKKYSKDIKGIEKIGKAFLEFAVAIGIISVAIYALSKIDGKALMRATAAVEVLMITMAGIAKLLAGKTEKDTGLKALWSGKKVSTGSITKGLAGLIAMAEAVKILSKALVGVAQIGDPKQMAYALGAIETMLWSLFGITKLLSGKETTKMTKGVASLMAMALAVKLLTKPVMEFASLDPESLLQGVLAVGGLMTTMAIMGQMVSGAEGLIKAAASMVILSFAIQKLSDVVIAFSALDGESLVKGLGSVVGLIFGLGVALAVMPPEGLIAKAAAFVIVAYALKTLSEVLMTLGTDAETSYQGIGVLGTMLLGLWAAVQMFNKVPTAGILKLFGTLALGALTVVAFGAAIGVFGIGLGIFGVGLENLAAGVAAVGQVAPQLIAIMMTFAIAVGILSSVGLPAIGVIMALSLAFLALGGGMALMGSGITAVAGAIQILTEIKGELAGTAKSIAEFVGKLSKLQEQSTKIGEGFSSIADPLEKIQEIANTVTESIQKLTDEYTKLIGETATSMDTLANALTTITSLNEDSVNKAADLIQSFITKLQEMATDSQSIGDTGQTIASALDVMKVALDGVVDTLSTFAQRSVSQFSAIGESLQSIATPLKVLDNMRLTIGDLAQVIVDFINTISGMKESATVVQEGASAITSSLADVSNAASLLKESFSGFTSQTAAVLSSFGKGLKDIAEGAKGMVSVKDNLDGASSAFTTFVNSLSGLSEKASTVAKGTTAMAKAIHSLGNSAQKAAASSKKGMQSSGEAMVAAMAKGVTSKKGDVSKATTDIIDNAAKQAKNKKKTFENVGKHLIAGMVSGIRSQQGALEAQVRQLELKAERAVKAKAKIHSPSRVWMKIGAYMGEGLALGISGSASQVTGASRGLATVSEDAVSAAIMAINNAMHDDFSDGPVITPIVDLSNIDKSAAYMQDSFGGIGVNTYGGGLAKSISKRIQNGGDPLESTLSALADELSAMTNTMNSRQLVNNINIEGSEDPNAFADALTRRFKLNARTM